MDCSLYRQGELATLTIGVRLEPEIWGGELVPQHLTVRPEYLFEPFGPTDRPGELDASALFAVEIGSGLPPTEAQRRGRPSEQTHLVLLLQGWAYSRPGFYMGTRAGAPIGEPLEVDPFEVVGDGPAGFSEIRVEGQDPRVSAEADLFAEIGPDGEPTALLKCRQPGTVPNPTCELIEQVGLFNTTATFRRVELPRLDLIRDRMAEFTACLTQE